ncbi:MAG: hypothetical protein IPH89_02965 [Bacteroidetes bacterium]|nr:hypothetical protein [Bacteroidota bacterium]
MEITQSEANQKTGTWKYWDEKGRIIKEEVYQDNILIKFNDYKKISRQ